MIKETGRVVAVEDAAIWVETIRQSTCQSCSVQKGCGHGILANLSAGRQHHVRALPGQFNLVDIQIDDQVEISIPERLLVMGALTVYLLPLLSLLAGAVLATYWLPEALLNTDAVGFIGAAVGFCLGLFGVKCHSRLHRDDDRLQPVVIAIQLRPAISSSPSVM